MSLFSHQAKAFLIRECSSLDVNGNTLRMTDIVELVDLFDTFLAFKTANSKVEGIAEKVVSQIEAASSQSASVEVLAAAVNVLAPAFESFIRKVAIVVFDGDALRLHGDSNYVGIVDSSLGKLLEGKLAKKKTGGPALPDISTKLVQFSYNPSTGEEHLYSSVRNIRNAVHESRSLTLAETTKELGILLFAYIHLLQENLSAVRPAIDVVFKKLIASVAKLESAVPFYIGIQSSEWRAVNDNTLEALLSSKWSDTHQETFAIDDGAIGQPNAVPVIDLLRSAKRFWLTGEPGSGKSTTLRKLAIELAKVPLASGRIETPIPCLFSSSIISDDFTIRKAIQEALGVDHKRLSWLLERGHIQLLIDGFNESSRKQQTQITVELQQLCLQFQELRFVVASRKFAVSSQIEVPVFELLPFELAEIAAYIRATQADEKIGDELIASITESSSRFASLAKNPLLLAMICRVSASGELPSNRARVLQVFVAWIFQREFGKLAPKVAFLEKVLSRLAIALRMADTAVLSQESAIMAVQQVTRDVNSQDPVFDVLSQLVDANLLTFDPQRGYGFFHELVLEYFAARGLDDHLSRCKLDLAALTNVPQWHEVIRSYVGLRVDAAEVIASISRNDVLLAVRCISAGADCNERVEATIVKRCRKLLGKKKDARQFENAVIALLELGNAAGFKTIVNFPRGYREVFNRALWNCERPEQVSLNLLRYSSTGRDRLHSCMSALKGRELSQWFLDSDEYTRAQATLIRRPLNGKFLSVVEQLEVMPALIPHVQELLKDPSVYSEKPSMVASCLRIASKLGLEMASVANIQSIFPPNANLTAQEAYSVSVLLAGLGKNAETIKAATEYASQCLQNGFVLLGCKIASHFSVAAMVDANIVQKACDDAILNGKVGRLLSLVEAFPFVDRTDLVTEMTRQVIVSRRIELFVQHLNKLKDVAMPMRAEITDAIVRDSRDGRMSHRLAAKVIDTCHLQGSFADVWSITSFHTERRIGNMKNLVTNEIAFFEAKNIEPLTSNVDADLFKNRLVRGRVRTSTSVKRPLKLVEGNVL